MKRLWIKNEDGLVDVFNVRKHVLDYKPEGFDEKTPLGPRYIEVMRAEDHDRIVAELKLTIDNWIESHDARLETIATQKRVIAILKACILREDFRCGRWPAGREAIDQAESVERGER